MIVPSGCALRCFHFLIVVQRISRSNPAIPPCRWHISCTFDPLHGGFRLRASRRREDTGNEASSLVKDQQCACTLIQRLQGPHKRVLQRLRDLLTRDAGLAAALAAIGEPTTEDATLVRWLTACKWDVDHAHALLQQHAQWRADFGFVLEETITDELAAHKVYLQPGTDAAGHAVLVVLARNHNGATRDLSQTTRLIVYALDAAVAACNPAAGNPLKQIVCLFDLSGLSLNNLDVGGLRAVFETLQQHYPERLAALYFLNAPLLFWGLWKLVCPLVRCRT